ncbi:MAG: hypothetical protein IC227_03180 [Enterococcus lacertideformus]|uniref:Uncharacterized protein n=1 Tax=Enterococcus lacertideformus TaxID=2771493 RepID=A0A931FAL3_9ENTE|nr:hypothetical protein [Enterococcus lacertideformus]
MQKKRYDLSDKNKNQFLEYRLFGFIESLGQKNLTPIKEGVASAPVICTYLECETKVALLLFHTLFIFKRYVFYEDF